MDTAEFRLLEAVRKLQDRQLAWTRELVAIPTVNPYSGDESAGSEATGQDWVEARLKELGARDEWLAGHPVEVRWIKDLYPVWCDPRQAPIALASQAVFEVRGTAVPVKPLTAWFDAAHLARQLNIPTLGLGCGTPGAAHAAGEYVVLEELFTGARTLSLILHRLLRG